MIIVKLKGGLGNQLFQYAFGRALATVNQCDLFLDLSFYNRPDNFRNFDLDHFNADYKVLTGDQVSYYVRHNHPWVNLAFNYLNSKFDFYVERMVAAFKPSLLHKKGGYFDGYWQSEQYFTAIRASLLNELTLKSVDQKHELLLNDILTSEAVSLHVRKSDYLNPANASIYANCDLNYYKEAIENIKQKFPSIKLFVFSDDFDWVSKNLTFNCNYQLVNGNNTSAEDIFLMSSCKHNIIANSTFSWWGAWLNNHPDKIVIAPKKWFANDLRYKNNIVPDSWVRIANN